MARAAAVVVLLAVGAFCLQIAVVAAQYDTYLESERLLRLLKGSAELLNNGSTPATALVKDYGFRDQGKPQIILIGDSITAFGFVDGGPEAQQFQFGPGFRGWAVLLNETLGHKAALVNMAQGGSSTKGLNNSMPLMFQQLRQYAKDVALVIIGFGANDAVLPSSPGWNQPLPKYVDVLTAAVEGLREMGIKNIMLMTPPPVGIRHPTGPDRLNNYTLHYARAVQNLAPYLHVPVADIYDALMVPADWMNTVMHKDQLHLSTVGNQIVHEIVADTIERNFPDISASGLPAWYQQQHPARLSGSKDLAA